jgi:peptidoglycan/xylan/chitin deacetylase (PgdA/CDA1 family)
MQLSLTERIRRKAAHVLGAPSVPMALSEGAISITFDDFPRTAWTEGGAVLASHGGKATYYVSGRLCGGTMDGQEQFRDSDLAALDEAGHEVGCHTFDHISAVKVSTATYALSFEANARFFA